MTIDVDARLRADADRWHTDVAGELGEISVHWPPNSPAPVRHKRTRALALAAAALVVLAAAAIYAVRINTAHTTNATNAVRTCGRVPPSTGRLTRRLALTVTAPGTARTGTTLRARVALHATHPPVTFYSDNTALVFITRGHDVVGRYLGGIAGFAIAGTLRTTAPRPITTVPVLLSGCPRTSIDPHHPDASRRPLPPGAYELVAVLGDVGAPTANLVSAPTPITITR